MYTHCLRCGRELKNEKAMEIGYGKVCKKKKEIADAEFSKRQITWDDYENIHRFKVDWSEFEAIKMKLKRFHVIKTKSELKAGEHAVFMEFIQGKPTGRAIDTLITHVSDDLQKKHHIIIGFDSGGG